MNVRRAAFLRIFRGIISIEFAGMSYLPGMIKSLEKYIDVKIANILLHISIDMGPPNIVEHDNVGLF